jgi:hypothetical protein
MYVCYDRELVDGWSTQIKCRWPSLSRAKNAAWDKQLAGNDRQQLLVGGEGHLAAHTHKVK